MRNKALPLILGTITLALVIAAILYSNNSAKNAPVAVTTGNIPLPSPTTTVSPAVTATSGATMSSQTTNLHPDLTIDADGLSKATVIMTTSKGVIKYKFYPTDAPNTVNRMVQLINQGFYSGLTFHRVVPGFVVQGGDPTGTGMGGSGVKLKAEFNSRHHLEGAMAMARTQDPNSADSQFYICLSPQPQLDHAYTIFGQVIDGMDVVRKLQVGDKMLSVIIQ